MESGRARERRPMVFSRAQANDYSRPRQSALARGSGRGGSARSTTAVGGIRHIGGEGIHGSEVFFLKTWMVVQKRDRGLGELSGRASGLPYVGQRRRYPRSSMPRSFSCTASAVALSGAMTRMVSSPAIVPTTPGQRSPSRETATELADRKSVV